MKLTNETVSLLNGSLLDLQDLLNTRTLVSKSNVFSSDKVVTEIGELLQARLGTDTAGQTELEMAAQKAGKQMGVFIQLNKTIENLQDLAGEEVDLSGLESYFGVLKGKLGKAFNLNDEDFKLEESK